MDHRFLGRTGVRVSRLAFGTMSFGTEAPADVAARLFARCRDAGVNFFDTANTYGKGRSEEILGRLIREAGCRDEVVLATKAYFPTGDDVNARGSSRYNLVRAVEASLRRLGTDRIDLFYLHRFDDRTALDESLRALDDMVAEGKILYPAVSNFAAWQVEKALGVCEREHLARVVCTQPMYSLVKRQAEVEILPMAAAEEIAVVPYSATGGGLLTGKYGADRRPAAGRLVDNRMYRTRYAEPGYYQVAERFTELARARGVEPAALAVAWVAAHLAVTSVLLGARNLEQLEVNLGAADLDVDGELYRAIADLSPTPPPATDRNEETSALNDGRR